MAYSQGSITSNTAKKSLWEAGYIWNLPEREETTDVTNYVTIFKINLDVTDIDYMVFCHKATAGNKNIKLTVGSTSDEDTLSDTRRWTKVDISGETGIVTVKLETKGNGVDDYTIYNCCIYAMES